MKLSQIKPKVEIAGTYIRFLEKILILQRDPHVLGGNQWCLPAGKLENYETPLQAALRETFEETGIKLSPDVMKPLGVLELEKSDFLVTFHIFHVELLKQPPLILAENEIQAAQWLLHEEVLKLPLIEGGPIVLNFCKGML